MDPPPGEPSTVLDVLIVGGGPGGTAAALRCRELGISALVIDFDDVMKRIRDYSKDKLILPTFGGGDRMKFPAGGELIAELQFAPIDKDEMCVRWKALYERHGIPVRIGAELTGLERRADGTLEVKAWDHAQRCDAPFLTRHLVLAIGRGVPRRFDIPGNTEGVSFRLSDPALYVGEPALVVGGGTAAAEAVIAISQAKRAGDDATAVYWSYRGDRLPRVSKALAEAFFEAYLGNGNIRYCPLSEPAAMVTGADHEDYLSIRVDRRAVTGRPSETTHLEFPKRACIACIGEDIPEPLLNLLGISMVTGGPGGKKRIAVTPWLESQQSNVYLIGDILSQAYLETTDFEADAATFREVKHRGNVKSALRDGVLIAEVIRQRLDGKKTITVQVADAETQLESKPATPVAVVAVEAQGPPVRSEDPNRSVDEKESAYLVSILPGGVEAEEYPVAADGVTTLGRGADRDISLPNDTLLSPSHASISHSEEGYFLRDDGSATGVFLRLVPALKLVLEDGDLIRAGRQFLLFSRGDGGPAVTQYDQAGNVVARHAIGEAPMVAGRQAPDVVLDAEDRTLSRRHLAMSLEGGKLIVKDLKSANGTYLRVRSARRLGSGDQFRIGQQLFSFNLRDEIIEAPAVEAPAAPAPASAPLAPAVEPAPPARRAAQASTAARPAGAQPAAGRTVTFAGTGVSLPIAEGQTVCDLAEKNGVKIAAECHSGICGSDPIRILEGRDQLADEPGPQEKETLEELCELEAGPCRLACMVRVKGPVKIEILKR